MTVEFKDNSVAARGYVDKAVTAFLHEVAGEIVARTVAGCRRDTGQTAGSFDYIVEGDTAYVGSPLENAVWEELGTGEFAAEGNGRKGGWWIAVGNGKGQIPMATAKKYHFKIRKIKGQYFAFTKGKKPTHAMLKAYKHVKPLAIRYAKEVFK